MDNQGEATRQDEHRTAPRGLDTSYERESIKIVKTIESERIEFLERAKQPRDAAGR